MKKLLMMTALLLTLPAMADEWEEEAPTSPWKISGFTDAGVGGFLQDNPVEQQTSLLELRTQLSANRYFGSTFFSSKTELVADRVDERELHIELRELFIDQPLGESINLRIGQQVLTWGTGDFLFLNDFFPKNWNSMFSGRDDDYLKAPSASIKATLYSGFLNTDLVITPDFTADDYITGERFSYFSPLAGEIVSAPPKLEADKPENQPGNAQYFLRFFQTSGSVEYAAYLYRGFYTRPMGFSPVTGRNLFPRLNSYGASLRTPLAGGIASTEFAYWDSTDDEEGSDPFIPNSQMQWLAGFEREAITNFTVGAQLLVRRNLHHEEERENSPAPQYLPQEQEELLTLRLTWQALQQKLTTSLFAFYSPDDDDYFIKPRVSYRMDDHWLYVVGANLFGGPDEFTQWGQFERNSNIYARVKYTY